MLRALALPGDRLWTPAALDSSALPPIDWLPTPRVGAVDLPRSGPLVPWAVVPGLPSPIQVPEAAPEFPLLDALRRAPRPSLDVQRRVVHRRFATELAVELGIELAGAAWLRDASELERWLSTLDPALSEWVLKAPLSAAGAGLLVNRAARPLDPRSVARAFARRGELLFEPWEARVADFGAVGWIDASGASHLAGLHELVSDARGGFRGVIAPGLHAAPAKLSAEHVAQLRESFTAVGAALSATEYRGPFGIDAYLLVAAHDAALEAHDIEPTNELSLRALVEINPRLSFGHLVHVLAERARAAGFMRPEQGLALNLGGVRAPPSASACVLVQPVAGQGLWAWLEAQELTS